MAHLLSAAEIAADVSYIAKLDTAAELWGKKRAACKDPVGKLAIENAALEDAQTRYAGQPTYCRHCFCDCCRCHGV